MNNDIIVRGFPFHRHVLLEITKRCNLHCMHCFTSAGSPLPDELSGHEWNLAVTDLIAQGFNAFTISGGEPLLELQKVVSVMKCMKSLNGKTKIYLFTNGMLLRKKSLSVLKPYIAGMGLSLDGVEHTHDWLRGKEHSYKAVLDALDLLRKEKVPVFIQSMVTPQTLQYMEDVVKTCVKYDVKAIRFSHADFFGRAVDSRDVIGSLPEDLSILNKNLHDFSQKYHVYITSNIAQKSDLHNSPQKYSVPALHILPNGFVLPWYGFPITYALLKYPLQTFSNQNTKQLRERMDKFTHILNAANAYIDNHIENDIIAYDNVISHCLEEKR